MSASTIYFSVGRSQTKGGGLTMSSDIAHASEAYLLSFREAIKWPNQRISFEVPEKSQSGQIEGSLLEFLRSHKVAKSKNLFWSSWEVAKRPKRRISVVVWRGIESQTKESARRGASLSTVCFYYVAVGHMFLLYGPKPYAPKPYAPEPYAPKPYAPEPYAPNHMLHLPSSLPPSKGEGGGEGETTASLPVGLSKIAKRPFRVNAICTDDWTIKRLHVGLQLTQSCRARRVLSPLLDTI